MAQVQTLIELSECLNLILITECVEKLIIVGGSGAGIVAQSYYKRNYPKVEAIGKRFNDGYSTENFEGWNGKTLVIISEKDPGFQDTKFFTTNLPNTRIHTFLKECGHLTPVIGPHKFYGLIKTFIDGQ